MCPRLVAGEEQRRRRDLLHRRDPAQRRLRGGLRERLRHAGPPPRERALHAREHRIGRDRPGRHAR